MTPSRPIEAAPFIELDNEFRAVVELFLLGRSVEIRCLPSAIARLVDPLIETGVLTASDATCVRTPSLTLLPIFGHWLFSQLPTHDPTMYVGDDSLALMAQLVGRQGGHALDLCCGPGLQSLHLSNFCASVVGVEVNPVAAALARVNVTMNERSSKIEVLVGDLYAPLPERSFDLIVANPPLLPIPDDLAYPFVGHGGPDGMRATWRILRDLPAWLSPDGQAQIIGAGLSDGVLPLCVEMLQQWAQTAQMNVVMTIAGQYELHAGSPLFNGLVSTITAAAGGTFHGVASSYARSLEAIHASHLCAWYQHLHRGTGVVCIRDLRGRGSTSLWFA